LRAALESARLDQPPAVGIFDNDKDGYEKGFNRLSKNFKAAQSMNLKIQKAGAAAAILLPTPASREQYEKVRNLPIEFLFSDACIAKTVDGKRLLTKPRRIHQHIDNLVLDFGATETTETHHRQIVTESKKAFAEVVVPTFTAEAFEPFNKLFALIQTAITSLEASRTQNHPNPAKASASC
jgi:hypothetical protein